MVNKLKIFFFICFIFAVSIFYVRDARAFALDFNLMLMLDGDPDVADLEEIAEVYAPVFLADRYKVNLFGEYGDICAYNIPMDVSFDGNWDALDNEINYRDLLGDYPELVDYPSEYLDEGASSVYYEVIASETHIFLTYYLYYPHDAGLDCQFETALDGGGHINDASSVMLIVRYDDSSTELEWVVVQDEGVVEEWAASDVNLIDGTPVIFVTNGIHHMKPSWEGEEIPSTDTHYGFGLEDGYDLLPIYDTLWAESDDPYLFCEFVDDIGVRFCEEPFRNPGRGKGGWAPWAREFGPEEAIVEDYLGNQTRDLAESYVDPIAAFSHLYSPLDDYSTEYLYNPYID